MVITQTWTNSNHEFKNDDKDYSSVRDSVVSTSPISIESKKLNNMTAKKATSTSQLELQFNAACDAIQNLPKNGSFQPSNELLLKFYGYFKQATQGPCTLSRPSIFKVVERAKYDAWYSVKHLSKEEAMQGYISEIKNIIETMPHNQHVQKLFQALNQAGGDEDSLVETRSTNSLVDMIADSTTNGKSIKPKKQQNGEINGGKRGRKAREPVKLNGNGTHHNGNHIKIPASFISQNSTTDYFDPTSASEDDEDYCDTSDNINGIDDQTYTDNNMSNQNLAGPMTSSHSFQISTEFTNGNGNASTQIVESIKKQNGFHPILQKLGGETPNSSSFPNNSGYQNFYQDRQQPSRPESTHSMNFGGNKGFGGNGGNGFNGNGSGGNGGSGGNPGDNYMNDSNRQILLILYRVQQDINNILTRLSYLESSVLSLQNHMQITRMENTLQMNNQSSAFSLINKDSRNLQPQQLSPPANENKLWSSFMSMVKSVDWKTFLMAVAWPLVIRFIFFVMKKVRFIIKLKRIKSQSKIGYVL